MIDSGAGYPFLTLYAYETGYEDGDSTLFVSCHDFYDPSRMSFHVSWDSFVGIFDDIAVYLAWDHEQEVRQSVKWNAVGGSDGVSPPSASVSASFLDRMLTSSHMEIRAHGAETVSGRFNTGGFAEAVQPVVEACK